MKNILITFNLITFLFLLKLDVTTLFLIYPSITTTTTTTPIPETRTDFEKVLRQTLLKNYLKTVIPVKNHGDALFINIIFIVNHLDIEETTHTSIAHAHLHLQWNDTKFKWNPENYGNISELKFTPDEIWTPDLKFSNTKDDKRLHIKYKKHIHVLSNGTVEWIPHIKIEIPNYQCIDYWPFDTLIAHFLLLPWTHASNQIEIINTTGSIKLDLLMENHNWEITKTSTLLNVYDYNPTIYKQLQFEISVRRKSPMLHLLIILPTFCMIFMCLTVFWILPNRSEKIFINGILLFMSVIFMFFFEANLPSSFANDGPLIVKFHSKFFFLISMSMILSVLSLALTKTTNSDHILLQYLQNSMEFIINYINSKRIGKFLKLNKLMNIVSTRNKHNGTDNNIYADDSMLLKNCNKYQKNWIMISMAFNRILFCIYLVIFILLISYILINYYLNISYYKTKYC